MVGVDQLVHGSQGREDQSGDGCVQRGSGNCGSTSNHPRIVAFFRADLAEIAQPVRGVWAWPQESDQAETSLQRAQARAWADANDSQPSEARLAIGTEYY